jgi:hypothetical protein
MDKPEVLAQKLKFAFSESENEHFARLTEARARLTPECIALILRIPEQQTYFSGPASPEVLRLLDLRLLRADFNLASQLYAYHFTPLGRDLRRQAFEESRLATG